MKSDELWYHVKMEMVGIALGGRLDESAPEFVVDGGVFIDCEMDGWVFIGLC